MTRFNVGGAYLDVPRDLSLTFSKKNILFAFDNIECERTTSFGVPANATNNRIFGFANWEQMDGNAMRTRVNAQYQDGVVVKDGYLYVDKYDRKKNEYTCIFITGELFGLKMLRDAGKIADFNFVKNNRSYVYASDSVAVKASASNSTDFWKIVKYKTNMENVSGALCKWKPSIQVKELLRGCCSEILGSDVVSSQIPNELRVLSPKANGIGKLSLTFSSVQNEGVDIEEEPTEAVNDISISDSYSGLFNLLTGTDAVDLAANRGSLHGYWKMEQWKARQNVTIKFPTNFPDNMFMIKLDNDSEFPPAYNSLDDSWFYGGYYFHPVYSGGIWRNTTFGTPLKGREIDINSGDFFVFVDMDDYRYVTGALSQQGFYFGHQTYSFTLEVTGRAVTSGNAIFLNDNVPDVTVIDLIKMAAAIEGRVLYYDNTVGIQFKDSINPTKYVNLNGITIEVDGIERKFSDYVQTNIIKFAENEDLKPNTRITEQYTIQNVNLNASKDLLIMPFIEGNRAQEGTSYVAVFDAKDTEKGDLSAWGVMKSQPKNGSLTYCARVGILKNTYIQNLCSKSTKVKIKASMSVFDFNSIGSFTGFYLNGVKYVWTEAQWQKGVATLTLAKL